MNLNFSTYIKCNRDYASLITRSEWQLISRQLTKADLAQLGKGQPVKYQDAEIVKAKGQTR